MKWIITIRRSGNLERLERLIRRCGGERPEDDEAIPMGDEELAIHVSGPSEMPDELRKDHDVVGVYPDSEMTPY